MQFQQAFVYLLETLISLFAALMLMRVLLQWFGADYYNQVSQLIIRITDPVLAPLRRVLPTGKRIDTAGVIAVVLAQWLAVAIRTWSGPASPDWLTLCYWAALKSVHLLLMTWMVLIIANVLISWLGRNARHPIIPLIFQLSEPLLRPVRRVLPLMGGLDFSPLVAILLLQFLMVLIGW